MTKIPNSLAIKRSEVEDENAFAELLDLYGLEIIAKEPQYYIIDGDETTKQSFLSFWNAFDEAFRKYDEDMQAWRKSAFPS